MAGIRKSLGQAASLLGAAVSNVRTNFEIARALSEPTPESLPQKQERKGSNHARMRTAYIGAAITAGNVGELVGRLARHVDPRRVPTDPDRIGRLDRLVAKHPNAAARVAHGLTGVSTVLKEERARATESPMPGDGDSATTEPDLRSNIEAWLEKSSDASTDPAVVGAEPEKPTSEP